MKLIEIIDNGIEGKYVPLDIIKGKAKQLRIYFKRYYECVPIVLVWNVTNSGCCTTVISEDAYYEGMEAVLHNYYSELNDEDRIAQIELICSNSFFLKDI